MKIDIVERQPVRVAYLRYTGPFGEPVALFWRNKAGPWLAENGLLDCPRYGVTLDDPSRTPPEKCRYDACVEMPPGLTLPESPEATIAGGRYAVTRFKGTAAEIGAAWGEFLREFHAASAKLDHGRAPFEHYPRGAYRDMRSGVFACELCLPVGG
jgi:AraC family transcriptional regulator